MNFFANICEPRSLWKLITENAERQIWQYYTPLQIVCQKPNIVNDNKVL